VSAKIDTLTEIPGLGTSVNDVRCLASFVLTALGVNQRADDGVPTVQTIYRHGCTALCADMRRLSESLEGNRETEDIANAITRLHDRLDLLNEGAAILEPSWRATSDGRPVHSEPRRKGRGNPQAVS